MENYNDQDYIEAKRQVEELIGFYWHSASYVVVNALLFYFDYSDNGEINWAYWPLLSWGLGLSFHAIATFGIFNNKNWEEKKIKEIMEKNKREREKFNT